MINTKIMIDINNKIKIMIKINPMITYVMAFELGFWLTVRLELGSQIMSPCDVCFIFQRKFRRCYECWCYFPTIKTPVDYSQTTVNY